MANIGSKVKGGAYPMEPEWRDYPWRLFKPFDPGKGRRALILDPFANEGDMLLRGAEMLNMEPYAVELQDQFIEAGREKMSRFYRERNMQDYSLTRFLHDDSQRVEMSNGAFSIVYLNPPFDDMLISNPDQHSVGSFGTYGGIRQRFELTALRDNFKYVAPNGYIIWIAYAQHMTRKVIKTFRDNCDNIMVFRFPEPHLDHYTQVCVIGNYIKGHQKLPEMDPRAIEIEEWFINLGKEPDKITDISAVVNYLEKKGTYLFPSTIKDVTYPAIPALNILRGSIHFESRQIDYKAEHKLNVRHGAHNLRAFADFFAPSEEPPILQPLHKPNKRQIAVNIAGGMLDNLELSRNGKKALLRGSVRELYEKIGQEEEQIYSKEGSFTRIHETTLIRPDHHIVLLYEDGEIEDLSGADALRDVIEENSVMLVDRFNERYKPFYDMKVHPVWRKVLDQIHPGGIKDAKFFRSQRYVIVCTIEHLAIRNMQIMNAQQGFGKSPITGAALIGLRLLQMAAQYAINPNATKVPAIAKKFNLTGDDLLALVQNICSRYSVKPEDLRGVPVNEPVIVGVPPIAPSIWTTQEIAPLYDGFRSMQLFTPTDVDNFMELAQANEDDSIIYMGVISYQNAKSNEAREPVAMAHIVRGTHLESGNQGIKKVVVARKQPIDPISGSVILDSKGKEVPWSHFTNEGRRINPQDFFVGKEFYGYSSDVVTLEDGKKEYRINWNKPLHTFVVPRPLTKDEIDRNKAAGYPMIATRYYPLFSELRAFGKPKVGNGLTETPMREVVIPGKMTKQVRYRRNGIKCAPYIDDVYINEMRYETYDFDKQRNLTGGEILDPWLWAQGNHYLEETGRQNRIDKMMRKANLSYYRVGSGNKELDEVLTEKGMRHYKIGAGQLAIRNPRYPVANYLRRFYSGKVAVFIADEIHLAKSNVTDIGAALRDFIRAGNIVLGLTGTLYGGKASSVFALAYAFSETVRKRYRWVRGAPIEWIEDMGVRKMVETRDVGSSASLRTGRKNAPRISEAPGASPLLQVTLSPFCLWASLRDMADKMPNKSELSYMIEPDEDQAQLRDHVHSVCREYNAKRIVSGDRSFLAPFYQHRISLLDANHRGGVVIHNIKSDKGAARRKAAGITPHIVLEFPSLGPGLHAKEREVIEWLKKDLADSRRIIITLNQTESRDIRPRWLDIINENVPGANAFILNSNSPKANDRAAYIRKKASEGFNIMITNGGLIATAISIKNFSAMYAIEYNPSLYTFAQYMARINRPNQEREDIVYRYFFYNDKFQHEAIQNIADKTKAAAVLSGAEGGDLASMMSSESRVQSYSMILEAIENGRAKLKSAAEIQAAFDAAAFNQANWQESAWYVEGDEKEDAGAVYEEAEIYVEEEDLEDIDYPEPQEEISLDSL